MSTVRIPDGEPSLEELAVRDLAFLWGLLLVQDSSGLRGAGRSARTQASGSRSRGGSAQAASRAVGAEAAAPGTGWPVGCRRGQPGVTSPLLFPPCMLSAPCSRCRDGGGGLTCLLLSPQNTALDKEGQIFGSKLGADGSRPGLEPAAPDPPASPESPPRSPAAAAAAAAECERAGTWRRHRD